METKKIKLPAPYVECVIKHSDGAIRIGRLNHNSTHWQLSSCQMRKVEVVWGVDSVVDFRVIDLNI